MKSKQSKEIKNHSWEVVMQDVSIRSQKIAWRITGVSILLVFILIVAITFLIPTYKVVPYVIEVDKISGDAIVAESLKDFTSNSELNDKYWVKSFVTSRERYNFKLIQYDYDKVKNFSDDPVWQNYNVLFDGNNSLITRYGENTIITPIINSITLKDGIASVRYELDKKDVRNNTSERVKKIATLRYTYNKKYNIKESIAIENPLGFTVTAYQTDNEL